MYIRLASLIICSITYHLIKTLSASVPEVKKDSITCTVNLIFCLPKKKLPFIENLRIKSLTCFKHQINITVVLLSVEVSSSINKSFGQIEHLNAIS